MLTRRSRVHLTAMRLVEEISASLGTTSYIWGGFTLDLYAGRPLREHHDLDYLTVGLGALRPELAARFAARGWPAEVVSNGDLSPRRSGFRMQLGQLTLGARARWTFDGERGYLEFPIGWLRREPVRFCGVDVHVVEPEFEFVVKCCPRLINPDWETRPGDVEVREEIRALLAAKGTDLKRVFAEITLWRAASAGA